MATPSIEGATEYLGADTSATSDEIAGAYAAEVAAQRRVCRIPLDTTDPESPVEDYPADLIEAVYRRVAHNLALRGLPLGVQATLTDGAVATTRVGGTDPEVSRLERPYRKLVLG